MTKRIRVENGDTSSWKVMVEVWGKGLEKDGSVEPDILVKTVELNYPADLSEFYIHSTQYLVIKENGFREDK